MIDVAWVRTLWLWIATAFRANAWLATIVFVVTLLGAAAGPLTVIGVRLVIEGLTEEGTRPVIGLFVLGLGATAAPVSAAICGPLGETLDEQIKRFVHDDLMRLTAGIPTLEHHENPELADQIALVERDVNRVAGVYRLISVAASVGGMASVALVLSSVDVRLGWLLIASLIPAGLITLSIHRRNLLWRRNERYRRLGSKLVSVLTEVRSGLEVRCYGLGPTLIRVLQDALDRRRIPWVRMSWMAAGLALVGWVVLGAAYSVAAVWAVRSAQVGAISTAEAAMVLLAGPQIVSVSRTVASNLTMLLDASDMIARYGWLRAYASGASRLSGVDPPRKLTQGIRLEGIGFSYPSASAAVLADVDITLPAGSVVALVGNNGAGKSTIAKLLAGLYGPSHGRITIDGVDLEEMDPAAWRARISAAFQDFARFEFRVLDAIGVGDLPNRDDRGAVLAAASLAEADVVVAGLPDGLETTLGSQFQGGVGLSGGEWQRLALARAFMRTRPLLMILDEPASALDPDVEAAIYDRYRREAKRLADLYGTVTIIVSHRLSTVQWADLVVVIAGGAVVEVGKHDELMDLDGLYATMFSLQARAYR